MDEEEISEDERIELDRLEKIDQKILEEYKSGEPIHIICSRYRMAPFELLEFIKSSGLDYTRVYKLEGKVDYNMFDKRSPHDTESHTKLVYEAIEEFWDPNKSFITLDNSPRPDVIIIDWENKEIIAVEAQIDSSSNHTKEWLYNGDNPLKPFDTLIIYNPKGKKEIELVSKKVKSVKDIYMKCLKCNHRWRLKRGSWTKKDKKYAQCSKCHTDNLIPESLK